MLNQEKEETQKRKQDYRRELDLIIKLKNKIRESEESQKMFDLRRQTGHVGDVLSDRKQAWLVGCFFALLPFFSENKRVIVCDCACVWCVCVCIYLYICMRSDICVEMFVWI